MTAPGGPDRLDPAERALADLLGRAPGPQGPSPALDAAILAAARTAATPGAPAGQGASVRRHRRRSPAWLRGGALAASLVFAVGVAWQLRPTFNADAPAVEAQAEAELPQRVVAPATEAAAAPAGDGAAAKARDAAAAPTTSTPRRAKAEPASAEPPEVFDAPAAMDAPASADATVDMPAPPPAAPASPAPQAREPAQALLRGAMPAASQAAPPAQVETTAERNERAGEEDWLDQPLDDTPPASVDSPEVREAWLARIRELVSAERYTDARESFEEFRRRHPDAAVPADLRMLLGPE